MRARLPGELHFLGAAGGAEHLRASPACQLAEELPDPARGGVDQAGVAGPERERVGGEVVSGHALQHSRSGLLIVSPAGVT